MSHCQSLRQGSGYRLRDGLGLGLRGSDDVCLCLGQFLRLCELLGLGHFLGLRHGLCHRYSLSASLSLSLHLSRGDGLRRRTRICRGRRSGLGTRLRGSTRWKRDGDRTTSGDFTHIDLRAVDVETRSVGSKTCKEFAVIIELQCVVADAEPVRDAACGRWIVAL